ncbi:hypothetical protein GCM10011492_44650 [Flexivirga endophytica]|jgi:hypothetical protein|uniref:Uncharacterized protein n=1 Tax=Flexivirga endophytica TaxID=1849103 RepID=A0A916X0H6_9MICO|nr:hypothetical protein [Flexivirga endophytica]GGB48462.1 hypothetical protein GCM10011492_44650 [Flexivirga endophytica]GHB71442.1 hypothetical protein GCM10008112_44660 [Flexivirga endophytica]
MTYNKQWEVGWQRDRARGINRYVDAEPTREKLQGFIDASVPLRTLSRATGISDTGISNIVAGRNSRVQRATAERVDQLKLADIYSQAEGMVPRVGAVRRVEALLALGHNHAAIAAAGARDTSMLLYSPGELITAGRWRQVRDAYDRLSMTPGDSPLTRQRAESRGLAPPLAWDEADIDDPSARPHHQVPAGESNVVDIVAVQRAIARQRPDTNLTKAERLEVVRAMASTGASDHEISLHTGVSDRTVLRDRIEFGIESRWGTMPSAAHWDLMEARSITRRSDSAGRDAERKAIITTPSLDQQHGIAR